MGQINGRKERNGNYRIAGERTGDLKTFKQRSLAGSTPSPQRDGVIYLAGPGRPPGKRRPRCGYPVSRHDRPSRDHRLGNEYYLGMTLVSLQTNHLLSYVTVERILPW